MLRVEVGGLSAMKVKEVLFRFLMRREKGLLYILILSRRKGFSGEEDSFLSSRNNA